MPMTFLQRAPPLPWNFGLARGLKRLPSSAIMRESVPANAARIAILFQDFAAGGTERIMIRLANEWAKSREVFILCGSERGPARERVGGNVTILPMTPEIRRSPLSRVRLGRAAARHLPSLRPDILVGPGNHVLPAFAAMGHVGVPIVCKLSNPADLSSQVPIPRWLFRRASVCACRSLAAIVAMSPALAEEAESFLGTGNIRIIHEPILANRGGDRRVATRSGPYRILCAGRLVKQKNVSLALHALAACDPSTHLTIAGDGPERELLERLAKRLGIARRVSFLGHVAEIGPLLEESDLLLLTSDYEGYPAVLVEALAAGVPIVATDCSPAIRDILADPSFGRIAAAEPLALAGAITEAVAERPGGASRASLIERHGLEASAANWLDLLDRLIRDRSLLRVPLSRGVQSA